jgi:hypothetical protein
LGDDASDARAGPWPEVRRWATAAQHRFAIGRGGEGFVIETAAASLACRIEWGPSQRNYIVGQELRVRIEVGQAAAGLQMLAATRAVLDRLESDVFDQFTEGNETRIDDQTPEEMRWVVMYPQLPSKLLGELLTRFGLLSNRPRASQLWLESGLLQPLKSSVAWRDDAAPMVLVVQRGRFVLRMALAEPRIAVLDGAMSLATAAAAAARRVATEVSSGPVSSLRPSNWDPASTGIALESPVDSGD